MSIRRRLKKQNTLPPHNGRLCRSVLPATPPTSRMPGEEPGTETTRFTVPFIRTAQRGKSTDREQISGGGGGGWSVSARVRGSLRVAEMSESNSGRQKQSVPNRVHLEERHLKKQAVTNQSAIQVTRVLTTREAVTETPEDGGRGRRCCWAP